tara:strand:+ start:2812 stop:3861 length:1050 start_codon:yes stop_codon:yes gene_type:complete
MKKKVALITGITGQDGSFLAKLLLSKNYKVHGIKRRASFFSTKRIDDVLKEKHSKNQTINLHYGDVTDSINCFDLIKKIKPDEVYHLAAQSHVAISFEQPYYTANVDFMGTLNILEAIRIYNKKIKFYNAASSEMYGDSRNHKGEQNETTTFNPKSPYAVSKLGSFHLTKVYRESYGMFASNGILFNHESEIRGENFLTRKVSKFVAKYSLSKKGILLLGNLDSYRDWGYAPDFVDGIWRILQYKHPDDFVLSSGITHSVKEFVILAFKHIDVELKFKKIGNQYFGYDKSNNKLVLKTIKYYYRPNEVNYLKGNYLKAKRILKWKPKTNIKDLIKIMVDNDIVKQRKSL